MDHFQSERLIYQDKGVCSSVDIPQDILDAIATITEEETEELETCHHDSIKSLSKVKAVGVMAKKSHHRIYSKLFEMVWNMVKMTKPFKNLSKIKTNVKCIC